MDTIELVKKIGAASVIVVLALMMAITFSSQPVDEILGILSGHSGIGSYQNSDIRPEIYYLTQNDCKKRYEAFGQIPDYFLNNCVGEQIKQIYTLTSLGKSIGIETSEEKIETQLVKSIEEQYNRQAQYTDKDDRLSINDIYRREMQSMPLATRRMLADAGLAYAVITTDFPVSDAYLESMISAEKISFQFKAVTYTTALLLKTLENKVQIQENEIQAEYERREKLKQGKDLKSYESQKALIRADLLTKKKQDALAALKNRLSSLKNPTLNQITEITGVNPLGPVSVALNDLSRTKLPGGSYADLARKEILLSGEKGVYGPYQDGENTIYAEIIDRRIGPMQKSDKDMEKNRERFSNQTASNLLQYLIEEEALMNHYKINLNTSRDQQAAK